MTGPGTWAEDWGEWADALNGTAWLDDSQVVRWECTKLFRKRGEQAPRTFVQVDWGADAPSPEAPWEG